MADIRPFRAWRYRSGPGGGIDRHVSPLFDVVTSRQLEELYQDPDNSIHLSVPRREPGLPAPSQILARWKAEQVIRQDAAPAILPYYQHFTLPGEGRPLTRKGFICLIKADEWRAMQVMRHEMTIPAAVKDRLVTLRETQMQVNPTHGLYHDDAFVLEPYLDEAMEAPLYETEDYQGVRDQVGLIQDRRVLQRFMAAMAPHRIVLADGHHRYEASVALRNEMRSLHPNATGNEPWNWHLMYLTNEASPDLRILATHRLIKNIGTWPVEEWRKRLEVFFDLKPVEEASDLPDMIAGKTHAFGFVLPTSAWKLRLKPGMLEAMDWAFPQEVKRLDLTVLHYYILWRILGIAGQQQRKSDQVAYERSTFKALHKLEHGEVDAVVLTNAVATEDVRRVAETGQTMPPKSTFFYPKVVAGFAFASLQDAEFYSPFDTSLGLAKA